MISTHKNLVLNGESPLQLQPTIACILGVAGALFVQQLHYLSVSKKTNGVLHEGKKWIYNTLDNWAEFMPFYSKSTLHNTIRGLEKIGVVESKLLRKNRNDRTKFYRVVYDKLEAIVMGKEEPNSDSSNSISETLGAPSLKNCELLYKENTGENAKENETPKTLEKPDIQDEAMATANDVLLKHLKDGKFDKGTLDYKPTVSNFEKMWNRTVPEHNNVGFMPKFNGKEMGHAKLLMKALEDKQIQQVEKVVSNWQGFCAYCRTMAGDTIKSPPQIPSLIFLLNNVIHIAGYNAQDSKKVKLIAQEKAHSDLEQMAAANKGNKTKQVEVPASLEETMAILNSGD